MNRRHFVSLTAAALALPRRLVFATPCESDCTDGAARVAAAFRRAERARVPLVVIVNPAADAGKYARGTAFGELLNHGSDAQLAPLALVEVVVAGMEELRRIVPNQLAGEPWLVVVATDRTPARTTAIDPAVPERGPSKRGRGDPDEDKAVDRRIAVLGGAVAAALPRPEASRVAELAARTRERLVKRAPEGARWAVGSGCGVDVEGEEPDAVDCGMGHVPAKSRRFLYLYAKTPNDRRKSR